MIAPALDRLIRALSLHTMGTLSLLRNKGLSRLVGN